MKLQIFSVKDNATRVFTKPFYMLTKAEAMRQFGSEADNPESSLHQHPHDYHLYYLGDFDQDTGLTTQDEGIQDLGSAASFQTVTKAPISQGHLQGVPAAYEAKDVKEIG